MPTGETDPQHNFVDVVQPVGVPLGELPALSRLAHAEVVGAEPVMEDGVRLLCGGPHYDHLRGLAPIGEVNLLWLSSCRA